jgi:signal transduction histidine kinase
VRGFVCAAMRDNAEVQADSIFVSALSPRPRQRQIAVAVGAALFIAFLVVLVFRDHQLPHIAAYIPVLDSVVFLNDLITALLLYSQYAVDRRRGALTLAAGYLFTAAITVPHLLTFPGAITANGLLGADAQTSVWLYVFGRLGLVAAVIVYVGFKRRAHGNEVAARAASADVAISAAIAIGLVIMLTWLATHSQFVPPVMSDPVHATWVWSRVVGPALVVAYAAALALLWSRRSSVLDLWLLLAMWAWFLEMLLVSISTSRFSVTWYAGAFGVLGSCFILIILLYDVTVLYARFALAAAARDREGERQRLTLQVVASSVEHEMQQPLTVIASNAEAGMQFLSRTPPEVAELSGALDDILAASYRASDIMKSVRATLTGATQSMAPVNMSQLIRETLSYLDTELRTQQVSVQVQVSSDLPTVWGNRGQLIQVLVNLITNALEAMHDVPDGRRVLAISSAAAPGDGVLIVVGDSGGGIVSEHLGRIFDPFFTTKARGTGLGLAICRRIIDAHGGSISASRGPIRGSVFRIELPVARPGRTSLHAT